MLDSRSIAVFGSSDPGPGDPLYEEARRLGALLAEAGCTVLTGGYGGVMEGASRGARERGGPTVGVTCEIFAHRAPNPYLDRSYSTPDLYLRQKELVERSDGYVVLRGRAGTISELALLWALHRAGCLGGRPVVLLGRYWDEFLRLLTANGMLERSQLEVTRLAATPREALEALREILGGKKGA